MYDALMPRFTLYVDLDVRYSAKNDAEAERIARAFKQAVDDVADGLPDAERQFTEVELRRGLRGKVLLHEEESDGSQ